MTCLLRHRIMVLGVVGGIALSVGCSEPGDAPAGIDGGSIDPGAVDGGSDVTEDAGPYVPYLMSPFERVYVPANQRYLNDHTVVRGGDGTWHVYGITNTGEGDPSTETHLLHATAPALTGPWTDRDDILVADHALDETNLWAPHAVEYAPGEWVMYYWGGNSDPANSSLGLRRATSTNLTDWARAETTLTPAFRAPGGRDPFLLHDGDRWLLYSVNSIASDTLNDGGGTLGYGQIVVTESLDITRPDGWAPPSTLPTDGPRTETAPGWATPTIAVTQAPRSDYIWGNLESPTVIRYGTLYYLFVTDTSEWSPGANYSQTLVFRSEDPTYFPYAPITVLPAHAAEGVQSDGLYYLTSCGWPSFIGDDNRGLSLAPMGWAPDTTASASGQPPCPIPKIPCEGRCVDAQTDRANCGGCGFRCATACTGGNCS